MISKIRMGLLAGIMMQGLSVSAQDAPNVPLQPGQQAQIQAISTSVIRAMRTAESAQEREEVIAQIKSIKQQVDLIATLESSSSQSLQGQRTLKSQTQVTIDAATSVLRLRLEAFKAQTQTLRDRQKLPSDTFWQRITRFMGQSHRTTESLRPVVNPLSAASITALDTMDVEVEAALALPVQERRNKLSALSQQLTLSKKPFMIPNASPLPDGITMYGEAFTVSSEETPTLQTRTRHRRSFSLNK